MSNAIDINMIDYVKASQQHQSDLDDFMNQVAERMKGGPPLAYKKYGQKNTPTSLNPQMPYIHGSGGLLSDPGQNPAILSNIVHAIPGMATAMQVLPDPVVGNPDLYGGNDVPFITTITGVTEGDDDWTDQPDAVCDDAPIAGVLKACTMTASYGRFSKRTRQIERTRIGRVNNRGETTDFSIANPAMADDPFLPSNIPLTPGNWINRELTTRFFEAGMGFQRMMLPLTYTGNPTNNSANGGRRQFEGFDLIYNTGKVDVLSQVACPGMDALILDNDATNVEEADANGVFIYEHIEAVMRYLRANARKMAMEPVTWVASMREDLFFELTDIWPVQQYVKVIAQINAINGAAVDGAVLNFSGSEVNGMRQQLREGRFLPIDGGILPVILDDGIAETTNAGNTSEYLSDLYIHPVTVLGGVPVLYWHFFDYDNGQGREFDAMVGGGQSFTTDGGRFYWATNFKNGCMEMQWVVEPRIMQHTPYLGARLQDIAYQPGIHTRSPFPTDANYYDGGRSTGSVLTGYPDWSTGTQVDLGVLE